MRRLLLFSLVVLAACQPSEAPEAAASSELATLLAGTDGRTWRIDSLYLNDSLYYPQPGAQQQGYTFLPDGGLQALRFAGQAVASRRDLCGYQALGQPSEAGLLILDYCDGASRRGRPTMAGPTRIRYPFQVMEALPDSVLGWMLLVR